MSLYFTLFQPLVWTHRLVSSKWGISSHEEVEAGGGDEGRNQANKVVVHIAGVAQSSCAGRHDGGNL